MSVFSGLHCSAGAAICFIIIRLTIHVNVICCLFCQHNGWDIDPNGGAVAGIPFTRQGTGPSPGGFDCLGRKAVRNKSVSPRTQQHRSCP